jgi:opacity protein-like surface antigen
MKIIKKTLLVLLLVNMNILPNVTAREIGKDYIRGDIGYSFNKFVSDKNNNRLNGLNYEIGIGATLSKKIRTDMVLQINGSKKNVNKILTATDYNNIITQYLDNPPSTNDSVQYNSKLKHKQIGVIFNIYYDFDSTNIAKPYIFSGLGYRRSSIEENGNFLITNKTTNKKESVVNNIKSKNLNSLVYQIGAGLGYEIHKDVYLDLNYKWSNTTGTYKSKPTNKTTIPRTIARPKSQHAIMIGIRICLTGG